MRTPSFKALNGSYKISDIGVAGEVNGWGEEFGQKTDSSGAWNDDGLYVYLTEDGTGGLPTGWYKDAGGDVPVSDEDVLLEGEAFYFTSGSEFNFVFSGAVNSEKTEVFVPTGFSMIGNPTPVSVKFSDLEIVGEVNGWGEEFGQKTDSSGAWNDEGIYVYLTEDGTGGLPTGWYKDAGGDVAVTDADILESGEAIYFTSGSDFTIKFPSAL